jgi:hypothetical protein
MMKPFPSESRLRWRRLDVPGREEARIERTADGWRLRGQLEVEEADVRTKLSYLIDCAPDWSTRRTIVSGATPSGPIRLELGADGAGNWTMNGSPLPLVEGALDVDLGFTPATNLLPIRRLALAVGDRAHVRTAWVRFPELRVEALEQAYHRVAERIFQYDALIDGARFQARLETDEFGNVVLYEGLWEAIPW